MRMILLILTLTFALSSCKDQQVTEQNNDETILSIKHRIYYGECLGYCDTQLIFDSTNVQFIQNGWDINSKLPEKDTAFIIQNSQWQAIIHSFSINDFFRLDSAYVAGTYVDDGLVTTEIFTNNRHKRIRHDYSKYIQPLDSLYHILKYIREDLKSD